MFRQFFILRIIVNREWGRIVLRSDEGLALPPDYRVLGRYAVEPPVLIVRVEPSASNQCGKELL